MRRDAVPRAARRISEKHPEKTEINLLDPDLNREGAHGIAVWRTPARGGVSTLKVLEYDECVDEGRQLRFRLRGVQDFGRIDKTLIVAQIDYSRATPEDPRESLALAAEWQRELESVTATHPQAATLLATLSRQSGELVAQRQVAISRLDEENRERSRREVAEWRARENELFEESERDASGDNTKGGQASVASNLEIENQLVARGKGASGGDSSGFVMPTTNPVDDPVVLVENDRTSHAAISGSTTGEGPVQLNSTEDLSAISEAGRDIWLTVMERDEYVWVEPYRRSDGTAVSGHHRRLPDTSLTFGERAEASLVGFGIAVAWELICQGLHAWEYREEQKQEGDLLRP